VFDWRDAKGKELSAARSWKRGPARTGIKDDRKATGCPPHRPLGRLGIAAETIFGRDFFFAATEQQSEMIRTRWRQMNWAKMEKNMRRDEIGRAAGDALDVCDQHLGRRKKQRRSKEAGGSGEDRCERWRDHVCLFKPRRHSKKSQKAIASQCPKITKAATKANFAWPSRCVKRSRSLPRMLSQKPSRCRSALRSRGERQESGM